MVAPVALVHALVLAVSRAAGDRGVEAIERYGALRARLSAPAP